MLRLNKFGLEMEKRFLEDYIRGGIFQVRSLYILGFLLYGVFAILDNWLLPQTKQTALIIRFGLVMPFLLGAFLMTFTRFYLKYHECIATFIFFLTGSGIIIMMAFSKPEEPGSRLYYTGLILILIATYSIIRIRFKFALLTGLALNLSYPVVALLIQEIHNTSGIGWVIVLNNMFFLTGAHIVTILAGYSLESTYRNDFRARQSLREEHERAESLLQAILPDSIAKRLKSGETTIADEYDNVSILFADIVGFTQLSHKIAPLPLVKELNKLFSEYDDIAQKYGIEKIKTIGDNYMIAAGIPTSRKNHAELLADFALDVRKKTSKMKLKTGDRLQIRIGIHSGKAAGGVIGKNKFMFDVWGDAVNIASRMESNGPPGEIQISETTYNILKNKYSCEVRGNIEVKGKGKMKVYILKDKIKNTDGSLKKAG